MDETNPQILLLVAIMGILGGMLAAMMFAAVSMRGEA